MTESDEDVEYFSASQLKTFRKCPKQYYFKYISDKEPTKADKGYRPMGSAVHEAIEVVLGDDPDLQSQEKLEWKFEEALKTLDYEYPEEMHDTAMGCISNAARFIANYSNNFNDGKPLQIRDVEADHKFSVNRPDLNVNFRAIMDLTTEGEIWDWKTGKRREDDETLQAAIYLAAYANKYGDVPEALRFVYLKEREVETIRRTDDNGYTHWSSEERPDGWEEAMSIAKRLKRAWRREEWPANPGDHCYWCDWELFCPDSPAGVGNVSYETY